MNRTLETAPRPTRAARWPALTPSIVALVLVPALAWTASVPHGDFQAGDPISAAEINANFQALVEQLSAVEAQTPGAIAISESSGPFSTSSNTPVPVPNLELDLTTRGGLVRLELTGAPGTSSRLWLIGSGGGPDPWLFGYIGFERSADGRTWEYLADVDFGGIASAIGTTALPPGGFVIYDDPPAGTWHYRVTANDYGAAGEDCALRIDNVRLVAREIGAAP